MSQRVQRLLAPGQRTATLGVVAVRPEAYLGETTAAEGPVVLGATGVEPEPTRIDGEGRVFSLPPRSVATWHMRTGVLGFVDLSPGEHRIEVIDPQGRYLPLALQVNVDDWHPRRAALREHIEPPPDVDVPIRVTARLRPAHPQAMPGGNTVVWGVAGQPEHPLPFARVEIRAADETLLYRTYADQAGVWTAWLRGPPPDSTAADDDTDVDGVSDTVDDAEPAPAPPPLPETTLRLSAWPLIAPTGDPAADLPVDFDQMAEAGDFSSTYRPAPLTPTPTVRAIKIGLTTRIDLLPTP